METSYHRILLHVRHYKTISDDICNQLDVYCVQAHAWVDTQSKSLETLLFHAWYANVPLSLNNNEFTVKFRTRNQLEWLTMGFFTASFKKYCEQGAVKLS